MKKISLILLLAITVTTLTACETSKTGAPGIIEVPNELTTEPVNIVFWHGFHGESSDLIHDFATEFELLYPNVTIQDISKASTKGLPADVVDAYFGENAPTMVLGYPNELAEMNRISIPLDDYILDKDFGIDLSDFNSDFVNESKQYEDGYMLSLPFSKYTQILIINKDKFTANGLEVKTDEPYTWAELDALAEILVGDGPNQCEYLINYDKSNILFTTGVAQWNGEYANSEGDILVDNPNTIAMMESIKERFDNKTFAVPAVWDVSYGSEHFKAEDVCMSVTPPSGIPYYLSLNDAYDIEIGMVPQYDLDNIVYHQYGMNLSIIDSASEDEALAAWLFMAYMTNTENSARWALTASSVPVRNSSFDTNMYWNFLNYPIPENVYQSMAMNQIYLQKESFQYVPSFPYGPQYFDSASLNDEVKIAIEELLLDEMTVEEIIARIYSNLE